MKHLIFLSILCISLGTHAQQKSTPALPKVWTAIGGFKGGNITPELLSRAVDSALVVRDDKGNTYPIVRYRVFYKFKSTYSDPETGQTRTVDDMRVNDFTEPVMSRNWRESIKDNAAKGDEMIIDEIIVQLKDGKKMMAPALHFKVI